MKKILGKEINRRDFVKAASIGMLGAATVGFPGILRSAEKWRFKFGSHEPANSMNTRAHFLWWCDRVEQLSSGAVKFDRFPGEILVKSNDLYEACRDGVIQAAPFLGAQEAGQIPLPTIKELPFSFVSFETNHLMWNKLMAIGLNDYFHTYGVQIVADMTLPPYDFWTTKKWGPIRRLEDLKGCKVRVPGGYLTNAAKAMGAVPISIPAPDAYTALERGTIDGCAITIHGAFDFRLFEVAKFVSGAGFVAPGIPLMVNLKVYDSLPKDIQNVMLQAGEEAYANLTKQYEKYDKEVATPTVLKNGVEVISLPDEERKKMKKACAPVWDDWLAKNGDTFNGLGKKMFDVLVQTVGRP